MPKEALGPGELEKLYRFAAIPEGFERWQERNCFPRPLHEVDLGRTASPVGAIVSVAGHDALVVDPGTAWLGECAASGLPATGAREVTGADLLEVISRIGAVPQLASADIREIGVGKGRRATGGGSLYALVLGTPHALVRVHCFEDIPAMISRAADALRGGGRPAVR